MAPKLPPRSCVQDEQKDVIVAAPHKNTLGPGSFQKTLARTDGLSIIGTVGIFEHGDIAPDDSTETLQDPRLFRKSPAPTLRRALSGIGKILKDSKIILESVRYTLSVYEDGAAERIVIHITPLPTTLDALTLLTRDDCRMRFCISKSDGSVCLLGPLRCADGEVAW